MMNALLWSLIYYFFLQIFFIVTKLVARKTDDSALSEIVGFVFNTQQ